MGECTMTKNQSRAPNTNLGRFIIAKVGRNMRPISLTFEDGTTIAYGSIDGAWL